MKTFTGERFALIGAGAVATALGPALRASGMRATGVAGRAGARQEILAQQLDTMCASPAEVVKNAELVCLCIPDEAIATVAALLATAVPDWSDRLVLHLSGALDEGALLDLENAGAMTLAFHPIQSFVYPSVAGDLQGVWVGMSGEPDALVAGAELARRLEMKPVPIPSEMRPAYHLASSLASNGLVTLVGMAQELLAGVGIELEMASAMLGPLIERTAMNVIRMGPEAALTGPVVRGDARTVEGHMEAAGGLAPHLTPTVGALVTEAVRLGIRSGRLAKADADRILDVVGESLRDPHGGLPGEEP